MGLGANSGFSAPALYQKDGNYYLIATPPINDFNNGTMIFEITDIENGLIKRSNDIPVILLNFSGKAGTHNGVAT
ncbi:MAG: hypothetical protein RBG13Loki_4150 [Promethearchaeota archaeon CR_4]|nr:MAG: hypothetical protein RBG13Loki_4150 [Candidatus Lokiarchaeota archaeon CR_4]